MNIFIDTQDMEERYGEELYKEYLENQNKQLKSILTELEEWLSSYLYMLNGITDKDIYEEQQLGDFTDFMDKIQELKEKYK